ncbi:hypothetical protein PHYSODRAFT_336740 [Phytophthora sojae]|uniref:Uncharacterized protein n=1 Tax=Phytophthora sojae (strain P6497) TaxID=1094619 RepID=G4ZVW7_PHYSP|nr:hypothetical protein PHYSODRAFT_336740 [Phytophthora sojae]EGZ12303.1 hypothetical protein PHYSODRAFT_336740 [Phytophthora sojae]|eukprot:XP_009532636.1 hypothetical protein PHYSODRAFT_336740 [Phytophthora sojae]
MTPPFVPNQAAITLKVLSTAFGGAPWCGNRGRYCRRDGVYYCSARLPGTTSSWVTRRFSTIIYSFWLILRGTFIRAVWLNRNRVAFDRPALAVRAVAAGVRPLFIAHLRSLRRRHRKLKIDFELLRQVLESLVSASAGRLPANLAGIDLAVPQRT